MKRTRITFFLIGLVLLSSCKIKQEKSKVNLKIMSYNIRHGLGLDDILDLSRSAKIIQLHAPDLCGLQEIDNFCLRSDSIGQIDYLSQKTHMKSTFGKFMDYENGEYGMATLSKTSPISTKILELPAAKYEPRVSIIHEIQISEGYNIVFANVHFDWVNDKEGNSARLNQAKTLLDYINKLNKPTIITGDFNCTPESKTMQYFTDQGFVFVKKGADNLSFQGKNKAEIDHLIYRNTDKITFKAKRVKLLTEPVTSDHRPLLVELELILNK